MQFFVLIFLLISIAALGQSYGTYVLPSNRKALRPTTPFRFCELPRLKNGVVRLRQRGRLIVYKCNVPFLMIGDRYASCVNGKWDTQQPTCVKNGCPVINVPVNSIVYPQYNNAVSTMFCHTGYQRVGSARAYCDGAQWDRPLGICRELSTEAQTTCDFESDDLCGWSQDANHDFDWKRTNGVVFGKIVQVAPTHDHTIGLPLQGYYMYLDMKDGELGTKARIVSPSYNQTKSVNACFRLYYHMYGMSPGKLSIYAKPLSISIKDAVQNISFKQFEVSGNQKNLWKEGFFSIPEFKEEFQIVIEGTATLAHESHIAIDDLALFNGTECKSHVTQNETEETEGLFGTLSCQNRCSETDTILVGDMNDYVLFPNGTAIKKCDCFYGCDDISTCCNDFRAACSEESDSTTPEEDFPSETPMVSTTKKTTVSVSTSTVSSTTSKTTKNLRTTTDQPTTKQASTTPRIIPSTTTKSTTVKKISPTTKPTTTQKSTTKITTTTPKVPTTKKQETDIADVTPLTGYDEDYSDEDTSPLLPKRSQEYNFPDKNSNSGYLVSSVITSVLIFIILIGIAGGIVYYRRIKFDPRNYKQNTNKNRDPTEIADEFSEVRYLTCDEHLDFSIQTPRESITSEGVTEGISGNKTNEEQ